MDLMRHSKYFTNTNFECKFDELYFQSEKNIPVVSPGADESTILQQAAGRQEPDHPQPGKCGQLSGGV